MALTGVPPLDLRKLPALIYLTRAECDPRTVCVSENCPQQMRRAIPWRVEDFLLHKQLYKGKASLLYSATCRFSKIPIALKLYRKAKLSTLNWYQVEREIRIHSQLSHKHIINLFAAFEDSENVYLAQEFAAGGDLYEDLKRHKGTLGERRVALQIVHPCMQALAYLHDKGIIHRDIKSENILLTGDGTLKLADFGLSINFRDERPVTKAGTLDMMAPEVLLCPEKSRPEENKDKAVLEYTAAVDAWAVGIVCYELLLGHPPFERESPTQTSEHIMYRAPPMPPSLSPGAKHFIISALVKAASKRPSVEQLMQHAWLRDHMQEQLLRDQAALASTLQAKKVSSGPTSVSITIDCTAGAGGGGSSGNSGSSSNAVSSTGSADSADTKEAKADGQQADASKQSVLQWAGSSLKTMGKKLRKPLHLEPENSPAVKQTSQTAASSGTVVTPRPCTASKPPEPLPGVYTPAVRQLHIQVPQVEAEYGDLQAEGEMTNKDPASPFSAYAAIPPSPAASPRIEAGGYRSPSRFGSTKQGLQGSGSEAAHRMKSLRLTPRQPSKSLATMLPDSDQRNEASQEGQRRRDLQATRSGLEANPASPPAYLARPWLTQRLPSGPPDQTPPSPIAHTPSPLARRRRRIAGNAETSSSGAMSFADTPKGGHFPSGPNSARSFSRTSRHPCASPTTPKASRSQNAGQSGRKGRGCGLPPSPRTPRQNFGSNTLPRAATAYQEGPLFHRAFSANPIGQGVARKLSMTKTDGS